MSQDKGMTMTSRSQTKCEGGERHGQYELEDSEGKTKEKLTDIQTRKEGPRVGLGPYVHAITVESGCSRWPLNCTAGCGLDMRGRDG